MLFESFLLSLHCILETIDQVGYKLGKALANTKSR